MAFNSRYANEYTENDDESFFGPPMPLGELLQHRRDRDVSDYQERLTDKFKEPAGPLVEPTDDEYGELKGMDIDPNTFDKATVKRLRNMPGVKHSDLVSALSSGVPLEDYEDARKNNPSSHIVAVDEAQKYRDHYEKITNENKKNLSTNVARDLDGVSFLSDVKHDNFVKQLFGHHMSLKTHPGNFGEPYSDVPNRRRANEWVMNECSKLLPSLKSQIPNEKHYDGLLLNHRDYTNGVENLLNHYNIKSINAKSVNDYIINRRKKNAVLALGTSEFVPTDYSHGKYEED